MADADAPFRVPVLLDQANSFFWTSGRDGRLRFLRCRACEYFLHPPGPRCPRCGGSSLGPEAVSGRGSIYSYTVNHQPWMGDAEPYVVAVVEMAEQEGLRLTTNIVGSPVEEVAIGQEVQVTFEHHDPVWVPVFERLTP